MTIDWATIKTDVATAMASALASAQGEAFAKFPIPSIEIQATYTWDGSDTILTSDTSEVNEYDPGDPPPGGTTPVTPASYLKLGEDGDWYKVIDIVTDTSIQVEDTYGVGSFPSGSSTSYKSDGPVPDPPSSDSLEDKLATPIANAVIDGVKDALDQAVINDVADDPGNTVGPGVIV